jgi:ankyrin repeat protein
MLTTLQAQSHNHNPSHLLSYILSNRISKNQNSTAMSLSNLPRELLQEIAYHLDDAGLNTFCLTNCQVYDFLNLYLYRRDMTNKSNQQGRSLCWGARKGVKATVQWAIAAGRQQQHLGSPLPECYRYALNIAVRDGKVHLVKLLLEVNGIDVNGVGRLNGVGIPRPIPNGNPLILAVKEGHGAIVKLLLDVVDIDPNIMDPRFHDSALHLACERGDTSIINLLLAKDSIDINLWGNPTHASC